MSLWSIALSCICTRRRIAALLSFGGLAGSTSNCIIFALFSLIDLYGGGKRLDFLHAHRVLDNPLRMDVSGERKGERRIQAFAYVTEVSAVLTVIFTERDTS